MAGADLYCGYRHNVQYEYKELLSIKKNGIAIAQTPLTNPEAFEGSLEEGFDYYYTPHDVDGDGKDEEFIVVRYGTCNGNFIKFVRYNKVSEEFETIPIQYKNNTPYTEIYVDHTPGTLQLDRGKLYSRYYFTVPDDRIGFYDVEYMYDKKFNLFRKISEKKVR